MKYFIISHFIFLYVNLNCFCQSSNILLLKEQSTFYKDFQLLKGFHNNRELKCRNLNRKMINWVQKDISSLTLDTIIYFYFYDKLDSINLETVFSKNDTTFMIDQIKMCNNRTWENFNPYNLININPSFRNSKDISYFEFSIPVFSKDMDKCIIKANYYINQNDFILRTILFIKSKKGIWKEKAIIYNSHPIKKY